MSLRTFFSRFFAQPPAKLAILHADTKRRFIYQAQPDEWKRGKDNTRLLTVWMPSMGVFMGDCDDFAATVAYLIGSGGIYAELNRGSRRQPHAVCIYEGWVSDNERRTPYPVANLDGVIRRRLDLSRSITLTANGYKIMVMK